MLDFHHFLPLYDHQASRAPNSAREALSLARSPPNGQRRAVPPWYCPLLRLFAVLALAASLSTSTRPPSLACAQQRTRGSLSRPFAFDRAEEGSTSMVLPSSSFFRRPRARRLALYLCTTTEPRVRCWAHARLSRLPVRLRTGRGG